MREITIDERKYRLGQLDVFQQFHIARRLAPMMAALIAALKDGATPQTAQAAPESAALDLALGPLADVLAEMKQDDVDFVLKTCLGTVQVVEANNTAVALYDKGTRQLRYSDITMSTMLNLTVNVIQDNLGSFFPTGQPTPAAPQG